MDILLQSYRLLLALSDTRCSLSISTYSHQPSDACDRAYDVFLFVEIGKKMVTKSIVMLEHYVKQSLKLGVKIL